MSDFRSGSPMTERELFARFVEDISHARDAARGLAHSRKDMRWLQIAGLLQRIHDNAKFVATKPQGIVIPGR